MFSPSLEHFLKQNEGKRIVFTNGCFDILHRGHVTYLAEARKLGDLLVVGVNSDASVKRLKGPERPINNENDRAYVLSQLKSVDFTEIFTEDTPLNLILKVKPKILVKGGDWKIDQIVGAKEVLADGGDVFSLNFVDGYSTTSIIQKIQA
ncbi:D-glycero-beta-D-manno-heptose 1-phosphate adenylyltransferase [Peredibacter sp. HCB2-198]|uniref:D-glycero-beta-D-manno-heptose 1-phosphate adenylyltransferase n=1 Tax=Peredibacter sp. HCB2-198 TaxID=3383025 RepID=UPI0038B522F3